MSNGSKAKAKRIVKKTAGTRRGRKIKPRKPRKPQYNPLQRKRPPKMTDGVVRILAYVFGLDGTKEEACVMAHIAASTYDNRYDGEYTILWKFKELGFDAEGNPIQVVEEREALFREIMDHAMAQPFIRARQSQAKNVVKGKEKTLDTFLTTRDARYKKGILPDSDGNFYIAFGNKDTPDSPFIAKPEGQKK